LLPNRRASWGDRTIAPHDKQEQIAILQGKIAEVLDMRTHERDIYLHRHFPIIVCLCGSTRFSEAFQEANLRETLEGKIVLSIGCDMRSDQDIFGDLPAAELHAIKARLDYLHLQKISIADEVLILNVNGYIGESTARELAYAQANGKIVRYLEPAE
jgi:hypothetical protein